jgi:hypothetical protein
VVSLAGGRRAVVDVVVSLIFAGWVPHDPVHVHLVKPRQRP